MHRSSLVVGSGSLSRRPSQAVTACPIASLPRSVVGEQAFLFFYQVDEALFRTDAGFVVDVLEVRVDGVLRNEARLADVGRISSACEQGEYLAFALGQIEAAGDALEGGRTQVPVGRHDERGLAFGVVRARNDHGTRRYREQEGERGNAMTSSKGAMREPTTAPA